MNGSIHNISLGDLERYLDDIIQQDREDDINNQNTCRNQQNLDIEWIENDNDEEVLLGPFKRGVVNGQTYYFLREPNRTNPDDNLDISINHLTKPILRRSRLYAVQPINGYPCFVKASRSQ